VACGWHTVGPYGVAKETLRRVGGSMDMSATRSLCLLAVLGLAAACQIEDIEHESSGDAVEARFAEDVAAAYCATLFACDPTTTCRDHAVNYTSQAECVAGEQSLLEEAQANAQAAALVFDGDCVQRVIKSYGEVGCLGSNAANREEARLHPGTWMCSAYHGVIEEGEEPCFEVLGTGFDECGANLRCSDMTCTANTSPCSCEEGEECLPWLGANNCVPLLGLGETCRPVIVSSLVCAGSGRRVGAGATAPRK